MAQNIWNATLDVDNNVKQNAFDWSHTNNLTFQIGRLTPVFCDLVPAKTSFRVNPYFALQMMPMVFPIQTRLRASISYFRYPLRALWKDYKDYIGNFREGLEEPYINMDSNQKLKRMVSTGSLGDYLGIPSTVISNKYAPADTLPLGADSSTGYRYVFSNKNAGATLATCDTYTVADFASNFVASGSANSSIFMLQLPKQTATQVGSKMIRIEFGQIFQNSSNTSRMPNATECKLYVFNDGANGKPATNAYLNPTIDYQQNTITYNLDTPMTENTLCYAIFSSAGRSNGFFQVRSTGGNYFIMTKSSKYVSNVSTVIQDVTTTSSPWYNSNSANRDKQIKLSAYAFRAYEGIYNSMYRDNRNNPYYLDGVVQYNQWIPTYDGGSDSNFYELRYANWEKDFLTTAVQSPQQGNAPLVGISTYQTGTLLADGTQETKVALVDEAGKRYSIEFQENEDGLKGVNYVELDNGTVVRSARNLMDLATSGISIPDLRMVNCYQKFLELNMRKGYSYKDIVEGRFDVKVRYADLLLPEFFGGFSRDMNMNAVTQTVDQDSAGTGLYKDALGSQAGVGYFNGNTNHSIECFCDEESIIMGILVVTPLPVYTQLLPKHFTYRNLLDHFNPEFNNIGFQPISYKEVCPLQAGLDNLNKTFGYQRPWYEYCQRYDQAHGLFRTDMSNFLMHRVFDSKPELSNSFLTIDPEQVTDVFSVTETTDKIYGQIRQDITVKLPVARVAIPRLD